MSLNIGSDLLKVAAKVTIHIDTTKFGPRQIKAFHRAVQSGIIPNTSAPSMVARQVRLNAKQPFLHFGSYGRMFWGNMRPDDKEFFDAMSAALTAREMGMDGQTNRHYRANISGTKAEILSKSPHGSFYYSDDMTRMVLSNIKFPSYDADLPTIFDLEVNHALTNSWSNPCDI